MGGLGVDEGRRRPRSAGRSAAGALRAALLRTGFRLLQVFETLVARSSLVAVEPFLGPEDFPWVAGLEAGWQVMRRELDGLLAHHADLPNFHDISVDQSRLTGGADSWKTFFFHAYGYHSAANCERCPETARLIQQVPGMTTAFFSILSPHTHIPAHRGPYRGVIRYHLGLRVPDPPESCGIEVGDQVARWAEGRSLLFDDTYQHRAWNDSDDLRVVLFMDVERPLRTPMSWLNRGVIKAISLSPYVQGARRRHRAWEERFEKLVAG